MDWVNLAEEGKKCQASYLRADIFNDDCKDRPSTWMTRREADCCLHLTLQWLLISFYGLGDSVRTSAVSTGTGVWGTPWATTCSQTRCSILTSPCSHRCSSSCRNLPRLGGVDMGRGYTVRWSTVSCFTDTWSSGDMFLCNLCNVLKYEVTNITYKDSVRTAQLTHSVSVI